MGAIKELFQNIFPILAICFLPGLLINIWICAKFANCATQKHQDSVSAFFMCFFLGLVGYLYVIALPDRGRSVSKIATPVAPTTASEEGETMKSTSTEDMRYICLEFEEFPKTSYGRCVMCAKENTLTFCKIKNMIGTREFYICPECMTRFIVFFKEPPYCSPYWL